MKKIRMICDVPPDSSKTERFTVVETQGDIFIGKITWCGRWQKYAFEPFRDTILEQDCLRDIADFCEAKTKEHQASRKAGPTATRNSLGRIACESFCGKTVGCGLGVKHETDWDRAAAAVEKEVLRRLKAGGRLRTKEQMAEIKNMPF